MTFTARRERGTHPITGFDFGDRWVVRDQDGFFVDCDQYRNDLKERYDDLTVIDEPKMEGLDGKKVRLMNGSIAILDYHSGTKSRPERYESRCLSHRFTMDGQSMHGRKYDIVEVL